MADTSVAIPRVAVSAPGKLILMGEHAAVYGRPALVVALGLRSRALICDRDDDRVELLLPDLGAEETTDWSEIEAYGDRMRGAWQALVEGGDTDLLRRMRAADPAHVVKIALAETVRAVGGDLPGMAVEVVSELPLGAGFGSSASVAVATTGALLVRLTGEFDRERLEVVALEVERRQHGRPSGVDHATVIRGGVQWVEPIEGGSVRTEALDLAPGVLDGLAVFHTGTPDESTGEMVEFVRRRFADRPHDLEVILDSMEDQVKALRELLVTRPDPASLVELIRNFERRLEELGVVPRMAQRVARALEERGGAAKISGAGGLAESAAGSLLAYHPDNQLEESPLFTAFEYFDAELGAAGIELEVAG